jgi:hypothetical protein
VYGLRAVDETPASSVKTASLRGIQSVPPATTDEGVETACSIGDLHAGPVTPGE